MNGAELRAEGVTAYELIRHMITQGDAQYHADLQTIREGLVHHELTRRAEHTRNAEARHQRDRLARDNTQRDQIDRHRSPGHIDPGPGWVPVYEPFTYTLPGPTTYRHLPTPAPGPVQARRPLRSRAATAQLAVRLVVVGAVLYVLALGALVEVLS